MLLHIAVIRSIVMHRRRLLPTLVLLIPVGTFGQVPVVTSLLNFASQDARFSPGVLAEVRYQSKSPFDNWSVQVGGRPVFVSDNENGQSLNILLNKDQPLGTTTVAVTTNAGEFRPIQHQCGCLRARLDRLCSAAIPECTIAIRLQARVIGDAGGGSDGTCCWPRCNRCVHISFDGGQAEHNSFGQTSGGTGVCGRRASRVLPSSIRCATWGRMASRDPHDFRSGEQRDKSSGRQSHAEYSNAH